MLWPLELADGLLSVGDGCTERAEDSTLGVEAIDDAREESRLGMRNIFDAALAPELIEPFSLPASLVSLSLPLPFPFTAAFVVVDNERVRRIGILDGPLLRFAPFDCGPAESNDAPERKTAALRRDAPA